MGKLSHCLAAGSDSEGANELDHDIDYDSKSPSLATLLLSWVLAQILPPRTKTTCPSNPCRESGLESGTTP